MGIVYILRNEAMPGLLKIGRTDAETTERMASLYSTGVPLPFECVKAVEVADGDEAHRLEAALHTAFDEQRCNPNREFFRIGEAAACAILEVWPTASDVTPDAQREMAEELTAADAAALKRSQAARKAWATRRERALKRHAPVREIDGEPTDQTLCGYGPDDNVFMADKDNPVSCVMCLAALERETSLERPTFHQAMTLIDPDHRSLAWRFASGRLFP